MIVKVPAGVIHETYITILDQQSGHKVITTIEVVRPSNKYAGDGRKSYKDKQREVLKSDANLVEIDLLRTGPHVLAVPESYARRKGAYDYLISINRAQVLREVFKLYLCSLRKPLPRIKIPLLSFVPDVTLDLLAVLAQTHERGGLRINNAFRWRFSATCRTIAQSRQRRFKSPPPHRCRRRCPGPARCRAGYGCGWRGRSRP